ncbi:HAD family hydrolase [Budviciaceae bacterium CWB-B4]|uniref:HAD family hydrolase n=1 Tax=Limnobaculum xujianqingii TaxID=2738837 RepID=A0A9D7AHB2_9GAMM|nr:HAD family hydrolase [Limnobaculum xujianqingii]MBK5072671.1 HAD family hydrolase [Limnobaculum xujianqingii]MBK5175980.1 HAD family hydrolase [Limnobaculum xujianqingii]
MSLKMVVTDLDGTLLTSTDRLTQASVNAFVSLKQQGILPVVATGRMLSEAQFAVEGIGATNYFMGMNGAQTVNLQTQETIYQKTLDLTTAQTLTDILDELGVFYQIYSHTSVYTRQHWLSDMSASGMKAEYIRRFASSILPFSQVDELGAVKMFVICKDADKQQVMRERLAALESVILVSSYPNYFEILPKGLNKGDALLRLCSHLGIALHEVAAIGDSDNDIEILSQAGVAIAMGNAYQRVKEVADHIAPSNDDDGVAYALTHIIPQYL